MARRYGGPLRDERKARMRQVLEHRQLDLQVVLEDLTDPHNAAAIYRSAEAFGAGTMHLVYDRATWPSVNRAVSAHSHRWMPTERWFDPEVCVSRLRERGLTVLVAALDRGAIDYREVDFTRPTAVVFGQERHGASEAMRAAADDAIFVPMGGFVQSLNVSVSAGVILSEALRQRHAAGATAPRWDDEREALLTAWVAREERRPSAPPGARGPDAAWIDDVAWADPEAPAERGDPEAHGVIDRGADA